jgi:hypothetical protein
MRETRSGVLAGGKHQATRRQNVDHKSLKTIGLLNMDRRDGNGHFPMPNAGMLSVHCETAEQINRDFYDRSLLGWDEGCSWEYPIGTPVILRDFGTA